MRFRKLTTSILLSVALCLIFVIPVDDNPNYYLILILTKVFSFLFGWCACRLFEADEAKKAVEEGE